MLPGGVTGKMQASEQVVWGHSSYVHRCSQATVWQQKDTAD